ncbi:MAG TPA: hypothetical protein VMZ91_13995 [Candidatus Paceibacterota bacterium]|nr:hypothetical protein [Candidatus Paceibacterota bacterium]
MNQQKKKSKFIKITHLIFDGVVVNIDVRRKNKKMETKSRYEVVAELEENKRNLIRERDGLDDKLKGKEKELKDLKRRIEDKEEEIKDFKTGLVKSKETFKELIESVNDSLKRFNELGKKEK